jgi:hypothetical protein
VARDEEGINGAVSGPMGNTGRQEGRQLREKWEKPALLWYQQDSTDDWCGMWLDPMWSGLTRTSDSLLMVFF